MYCKKCGSHIDETTGLCPICDSKQVYSNLKKAPENNSTDNKADLSANNGEYSNLKKAEQSAPVQQNKQMPQVNPVQPVQPVRPVQPVVPVNPVISSQPVRDISGWSKKDIRALDKAEKIEKRNRSTKIKNAIFKGLAVILASIITMTAVTGAFVYWDKLDIPVYANALEFVGLKNSGASGGGTGNNNSVTPSGNEDGDDEVPTNPVADNSVFDSVTPADDEQVAKHEEYLDDVETSMKKAEKTANKNYPDLQPEDVENYLGQFDDSLEQLKADGIILDYVVNSSNIKVTLADGSYYFYMPEIDGILGGYGKDSLRVATYQPSNTDFIKEGVSSSSCQKVDDGAKIIGDTFGQYYFSDDGTDSDCNYDDEEVSFDNFLTASQNSVIIWDGHGCYDDSTGNTFVVLGQHTGNTNNTITALEIENVIIRCSNDCFAVGGEFISRFVPDGAYANSIIYMGICSGGKNGESNTLISSLISKGASAVYAFNNTVHTIYCQSMAKSICEGLCTKNSDGSYYTSQQALDYAKDQNGDPDRGFHNWSFFSTSLELFGNTAYTLDWFANYNSDTNRDIVIVLDTSGSMGGDPLDQTKIASNNFIKTVLDENQANIGIVDYNSGSNIDCEFTSNADRLHNTVNGLSSGGGTNIESGLASARAMLSSSKAEKKIIVLMSDGCANDGKTNQDLIDYAETLKAQGIYIYTLGFFSDLSEYEKTEAQVVMDGIASEGCHYEVDDANNLVYFFDDIASQINGTRYIYVKIACPVDVTVKYEGETLSTLKEDQTRTSFGTLTYLNAENDKDEGYDFDSESEGDEDKIKMLRLKEGVDYDIQIEGYDDGEMNYSIGFMDENGEYTDFRDFEGIEITKHTVIDTKAEVSDTTTLKVDEDGDGKYDYTMKAGANGFGQIVKVSKLVVAAIFVSGGAVMLIAIVISVKKKKKRKALIKRAYKTA